jgi:hypothetical protein
MATIKFKAKIREAWNADGESVAWRYVDVPKLTRSHCDMEAFRRHPKYGGLANSALFPNVLSRIERDALGVRDYSRLLRLDRLPQGVTVDESGFLAVVSFEV